MKMFALKKFPWTLVVLAALSVFLVTACASHSRKGGGASNTAMPQTLPLPDRPVVFTQLVTNRDDCSVAFENNNCGGLGEPGDICLQAGGGGTITKANLKFVVAGYKSGQAEIQNMSIGIGENWDCPADTYKDFPDFTNCQYAPANPGKNLFVADHNHLTRDWNYDLTIKARDGCEPETIHPIINNGGGNSSSDDDDP